MDQFTGKEFERLEILIGKKKQKLLTEARIAIFGLGGVGSFACEGLARCGIENFILVDFDKINITNLNRQIIATHKNIGMDKARAMEERIKLINPQAQVEVYRDFLSSESTEKVLEKIKANKINFFLEAIDSLSPKVNLIKKLVKNNFPFISSMGAGGRLNPETARIGTMNKVTNCSLAKRVRKILRREKIDISSIKVVYSTEKSAKPIAKEKWEKDEFKRGRIRGKLGSICFVPAVFGMLMAYSAFLYITESSSDKERLKITN